MRPEEHIAMFHAANVTIGIEKVRQNETTAAPNILTSLQRMSTTNSSASYSEATHLTRP